MKMRPGRAALDIFAVKRSGAFAASHTHSPGPPAGDVEVVLGHDRRDDVHALAARRLGERRQPEGLERVADHRGRRRPRREADVLARVEVEDERSGRP